MSRPAEDRAIVDAGLKALAFDSGPPLVCDEPAATYERAADNGINLHYPGGRVQVLKFGVRPVRHLANSSGLLFGAPIYRVNPLLLRVMPTPHIVSYSDAVVGQGFGPKT